MGTYVVNPDVTTENTWTRTGGSSTHGVLADADDATYMTPPLSTTAAIDVGFGSPPAVPAGAQIRSVQPTVRGLTTGSAARFSFVLRTASLSNSEFQTPVLTSTATDYDLPAAASVGGQAWTEQLLTELRLRGRLYSGNTAARYVKAKLTITYNEAPVATVTGPAEGSTVVNTSKPTVTWTYSDPESEVQERYRVKVFAAAQYGATGFDPETSAATWDSGEVLSADTSKQVAVALPNDTFRAYVKVADAGSNGRYGAWDNNQFTVAVDPPGVPRVVASTEPSSARVKLDVFGLTNMLTEDQSSVETDATGFYTHTNVSVARSTAQAAHGSASLAMTATADGTMIARAGSGDVNSPAVVVGQTYVAMVSFRAATTARSCRARISWRDAAGTSLATSAGPYITDSTSGWTTSVLVITAPADSAFANVEFEVLSALAAEVHYVDKVMLAPASGMNLLTANQSSFETDTTGWRPYDVTTLSTSTALASHGVRSLAVSVAAPVPGNAGCASIPKTVVKASTPYAASVRVRSSAAGRAADLRFQWYDAADAFISSTIGAPATDTSTGWTTATVSGTAPANAEFVMILVTWNNIGETHYADEVLVVEGSTRPAFTPGYPAWSIGGFLSTETIEVERSTDGGVTWAAVRDASALDPTDTTQAITAYDHEAPPATAVRYRARATGTKSGNSYSSGWSSQSTPVTLTLTDWWLKDPKDSSRNTAVAVLHSPFRVDTPESSRTYTLLAGSDGIAPDVTLSNGLMRDHLALAFNCKTKAAYDALVLLRSGRRVLLLQAPERQWYVRLGPEWHVEFVTDSLDTKRFVHTTAVERNGA